MISRDWLTQRSDQLNKRKVDSILSTNKEKEFVDRIMNPSAYPVLKNEDGGYSTHLMGSAEVDGKYVVFPTLFLSEDKTSLVKPKDPVAEAMKTGEFIEFKNEKEAQWFSQNYKISMPKGKTQ